MKKIIFLILVSLLFVGCNIIKPISKTEEPFPEVKEKVNYDYCDIAFKEDFPEHYDSKLSHCLKPGWTTCFYDKCITNKDYSYNCWCFTYSKDDLIKGFDKKYSYTYDKLKEDAKRIYEIYFNLKNVDK
jgi:hypothetical protein